MSFYVKRDIEFLIKRTFRQFSVLILTGARQTGKSTLVKNVFPMLNYVSLDELNIRQYAKEDPQGFFSENKTPLIIDEIQEAPDLLSYIKIIVDKNKKPGQFIITGSQQFSLMEGVQESLAGRAAIIDLSTFSFNEIKIATKEKNWDWSELVYQGSYPEIVIKKSINRDIWYSSYIRTIIEKDIIKHLKEKNLFNYERFTSLIATRTGTELKLADISKELGIDIKTTQTWLSFLLRSQIIFLLPPYFNNLGKRIVKSPKLYFYDIGLASILTGHKTAEQIKKGPMSGNFFENLVISEAMKQNFIKPRRENLFFYRDNSGIEADLVVYDIVKPKFIEIKSTQTPGLNHIKSLLKFKNIKKLDPELMLISARKDNMTMSEVKFRHFLDFKL